MTSSVTYSCPTCKESLERPYPAPSTAAPCSRCGAEQTLAADAITEGSLVRCPVCGLKVLYQQKDFRQALGCAVVLVAAVLVPFTLYHGIPLSLVAAAVVDFVLYRLAPEVVICYRFTCRAHVRGIAAGPAVSSFDLSIHDYYRSIALGSVPDPEKVEGGDPVSPAVPDGGYDPAHGTGIPPS